MDSVKGMELDLIAMGVGTGTFCLNVGTAYKFYASVRYCRENVGRVSWKIHGKRIEQLAGGCS